MAFVLEVRTVNKNIISTIKTQFTGRITFSKKELYQVYLKYYTNLNESTFRNKIQELKETGIISSVKRGVYTLTIKPEYRPKISDKLKRIFSAVKRKNISDNICIWSSFWLNEFMIHQPMRYVLVLEVDNDVLESVYYFLRDKVYKKIYLKPDENIMLKYAMEEQNPLILLPFKSRSPVEQHKKIVIPSLEKILVDLFTDSKLFYWVQGEELTNIFYEAFSKYQINFSTMIAYARRRGIDKKLKQYLKNEISIPEEFF